MSARSNAVAVTAGALALTVAVASTQLGGGGIPYAYTSGVIVAGKGTTASPVTFTLTTTNITGTGSSGSPLMHQPTLDGGWFGDGRDGDVTISVDTTLSRDMFYDHLTVNSTKFLHAQGFRVFAKSSITLNGTIDDCSTKDATSGAVGAGCSNGSLPRGISGNAGNNACGTNQPREYNPKNGGAGGNGAAAQSCGAGQVAAATVGDYVLLRNAIGAYPSNGAGPNGYTIGAGGANGTVSGVGAVCQTAGRGGASGGWLVVAAPTFSGSGSISVKGGAGFAAAVGGATNATCGGGGGGSGGILVLVYASGTAPTTDVTGGAHGSNLGGGTAATDGDSGVLWTYKIGPQ